MKPVHNADIEVVAQHHSPFFVSKQRFEGVKPFDNRLYSRYRDESTDVIDAVVVARGLQLICMRWANLRKKVLYILDMFDSDPDADALASSRPQMSTAAPTSPSLLSMSSSSSYC